MTDTITTEVVDDTITALGITLERATTRLATERAEYITKRDRMVRVAHSRGTSNSIGPALDDLLAEFDLPRRGETVTMFGLVMVSGAVDQSQTTGAYLTGSNYVYIQPGTRLSWPIPIEHLTNVPEGATCACESPEESVRSYMTSYFGVERAREMTFQIGALNCGASSGCINGERRRFDTSRDSGIDWLSLPVHRHSEPQPPAPAAAGTDPQVGEQWYMVGNDTHFTGCTDGEAVIIVNAHPGATLTVRRVNGGHSWVLNRDEVRATA